MDFNSKMELFNIILNKFKVIKFIIFTQRNNKIISYKINNNILIFILISFKF